jgi:hypothetical protein
MTVLTITGAVADGGIQTTETTYAAARAGPGTAFSSVYVGQYNSSLGYYLCYEGFVSFDTSVLPANVRINSVSLKLYPQSGQIQTPFVVQARVYGWGATLESADWVAGDDLGALAMVGTWPANLTSDAYAVFTPTETDFGEVINRTGLTGIVLTSDRMAANQAPTYPTREEMGFQSASDANPPQLVIDYSPVWSAPRTWVAGEMVAARKLNPDLRDDMNETLPAKATAAGDLFYRGADSAMVALPIDTGYLSSANGEAYWGAAAPANAYDVVLGDANRTKTYTHGTTTWEKVAGLSITGATTDTPTLVTAYEGAIIIRISAMCSFAGTAYWGIYDGDTLVEDSITRMSEQATAYGTRLEYAWVRPAATGSHTYTWGVGPGTHVIYYGDDGSDGASGPIVMEAWAVGSVYTGV